MPVAAAASPTPPSGDAASATGPNSKRFKGDDGTANGEDAGVSSYPPHRGPPPTNQHPPPHQQRYPGGPPYGGGGGGPPPYGMWGGGPAYGNGPPPPGWGPGGPPPPHAARPNHGGPVYGPPRGERGPPPSDWRGGPPPPGRGPHPSKGKMGESMKGDEDGKSRRPPYPGPGWSPHSNGPGGPGRGGPWNPHYGAPPPGYGPGGPPPPGYGGPGGPPPHHQSMYQQQPQQGGNWPPRKSPMRGGGPPGSSRRDHHMMTVGGGSGGPSGPFNGRPELDMSYLTTRTIGAPTSMMDDDGGGSSAGGSTKEKGRGSYKCGRCGVPKKGHVCPYQPKLKRRAGDPPPELRNAAVQVEMDEFMTLRRLNIKIQGLPESYATEPYLGETMVIGEPHPLPPPPPSLGPPSLSHPPIPPPDDEMVGTPGLSPRHEDIVDDEGQPDASDALPPISSSPITTTSTAAMQTDEDAPVNNDEVAASNDTTLPSVNDTDKEGEEKKEADEPATEQQKSMDRDSTPEDAEVTTAEIGVGDGNVNEE